MTRPRPAAAASLLAALTLFLSASAIQAQQPGPQAGQGGYPTDLYYVVTPDQLIRQAVDRLSGATRQSHHEFWPCELSLLDKNLIDATRVHSPRQVTDVYLLALAVSHRGRFVTFDRSVPLEAAKGTESANLVVL